MAKTSYGYVERNLENDVNWAEVGKGFSDMLIAEREERKAKKEFLDSAMVQTQEDITKNAPLGYNTQFNDTMIGLASNSNAFVLAANKDLKAGRITPEEYMRKLQRINSSADTVFALGNDFNAIYEDKLTRMDDKTSGAVEQTAFEVMADLVNFNSHDFMIDKNGTIVAAPLIQDANGVTTLDGNNARSVQAIFNIAQNKVDRLDVENTIQEKVKRLGNIILGESATASLSKQGYDRLIEGIRFANPSKYEEWKKETVKEIMANDLDVASVLADYGNAYETTTDKNLYDKNKDKYIYVDITNGREIKVELTEKQKEDALDILDLVIESQVGGKKTDKVIRKTDVSVERLKYFKNLKDGEKIQADIATYWNQLGYGDAEQKAKAAQALLGNKNVLDSNILGFKVSDDGNSLDIIYDEANIGKNRSIDLTQEYTPEEWATLGSEIHGISNVNEAVQAGGGWKEGESFTPIKGGEVNIWSGVSALRRGATEDLIIDQYNRVIGEEINKGRSASEIASTLKGFGFPTSVSKLGFGNTITIDGQNFDVTKDEDIVSLRRLIDTKVKGDKSMMKNIVSTAGGTAENKTGGKVR